MFFIGFFTGVITTVSVAFVLKFYFTSQQKDELLAESQGKKFEDKLRLIARKVKN